MNILQTICLIVIALSMLTMAVCYIISLIKEIRFAKENAQLREPDYEKVMLYPNEIIILLDIFINTNASDYQETDLGRLIELGFIEFFAVNEEEDKKPILSQLALDYINEIQVHYKD